MSLDRDRLAAFFLAALITILIVGTLIVFREVSPDFKRSFDTLTYNAWLTQSILVVVLFPLLSALFYYLFGNEKVRKTFKTENMMGWTLAVVGTTIVFTLGIFLYYVLHYFGAV